MEYSPHDWHGDPLAYSVVFNWNIDITRDVPEVAFPIWRIIAGILDLFTFYLSYEYVTCLIKANLYQLLKSIQPFRLHWLIKEFTNIHSKNINPLMDSQLIIKILHGYCSKVE